MDNNFRPDAGTRSIPAFQEIRIGSATVLIRTVSVPDEAVATDEEHGFRMVAAITPEQAFETATNLIEQMADTVGAKLSSIAQKNRPKEVKMEFSVGFKASGKACIPILFSAQADLEATLKVEITWGSGAQQPAGA